MTTPAQPNAPSALPPETTTLREAKDFLLARLDEGAACPCCSQMAKMYRRRLGTSMALVLIWLSMKAEGAWVDVEQMIRTEGLPGSCRGDYHKLRYWGFIETDSGAREDGSSRTGLWRITDAGRAFADGRATARKYAKVFDGRFFGLDGEAITIKDALGKRFSYRELMGRSGSARTARL